MIEHCPQTALPKFELTEPTRYKMLLFRLYKAEESSTSKQ
jgi:hypothetical protein